MIPLLLSILCSSLIYVVFSFFGKRNTPLLGALVVNYFTAGALSYFMVLQQEEKLAAPWLGIAIFLGALFIAIFLVMAKTTQKFGLATTSVASKMSMVIPVVFAIWFFDESVTVPKVSGLILGIISVLLLTIRKKQAGAKFNLSEIKLPLILFAGSGIIDSCLKICEDKYFPTAPSNLFIGTLFMMAAIFGLAYAVFSKQLMHFKTKDVWTGGVVLGLVNYGSIFFLLLSLGANSMEASIVFPINNVGIVGLSSVLGLVIFRQKLNSIKIIGLALAGCSIFLLA